MCSSICASSFILIVLLSRWLPDVCTLCECPLSCGTCVVPEFRMTFFSLLLYPSFSAVTFHHQSCFLSSSSVCRVMHFGSQVVFIPKPCERKKTLSSTTFYWDPTGQGPLWVRVLFMVSTLLIVERRRHFDLTKERRLFQSDGLMI